MEILIEGNTLQGYDKSYFWTHKKYFCHVTTVILIPSRRERRVRNMLFNECENMCFYHRELFTSFLRTTNTTHRIEESVCTMMNESEDFLFYSLRNCESSRRKRLLDICRALEWMKSEPSHKVNSNVIPSRHHQDHYKAQNMFYE